MRTIALLFFAEVVRKADPTQLRRLAGAASTPAMFSISLALVAGCGRHSGSMGHPCGPTTPCPVDYACVIAFDGSDQCMASCTINETACTDGSACLALQPGPTHACYVGGDIPIGDTCTSVVDCVHTGICLANTPGGSTGTCRVACNLDGTVGCAGGGTCTATSDGNFGFCVP